MKSILSGVVLKNFLSFKSLVAKVCSLTFGFVAGMFESEAVVLRYAPGLSIGKEGPFVHIASMVARNLCRLRPFRSLWANEMLRSQVLAAGCAAGVSATFGTPVGGIYTIQSSSNPIRSIIQYRGHKYILSRAELLEGILLCCLWVTHAALDRRRKFVHYCWWWLMLIFAAELKLFSTNFTPGAYGPLELFAYAILGVSCTANSPLIMCRYTERINWCSLGGSIETYYSYAHEHAVLQIQVCIVALLVDVAHEFSRYGQVIIVAIFTALCTFPVALLRGGQKVAVGRLFNDVANRAAWDWDVQTTYLNIIIFIIFTVCG